MFFVSCLGFSVGDVTMGHVFAPFWLRLLALGANLKRHFLAQVCFLFFGSSHFFGSSYFCYENTILECFAGVVHSNSSQQGMLV